MSGTFAPEESFPLPWDQVRLEMTRQLRKRASGLDSQQLDDLVQEACVRLLRAARGGEVRDAHALLATMAHRTWVDHVRRSRRTRARFSSLGDDAERFADANASADSDLGNPLDRLEMVVQEVFEQRDAAECGALARSYFAGHDWQHVADVSGVSYGAVRKRWSRCLGLLREVLAADPDFEIFIMPTKGPSS